MQPGEVDRVGRVERHLAEQRQALEHQLKALKAEHGTDRKLADAPGLYYEGAAEIHVLLDHLGTHDLETRLERLATGIRLNRGKDDPAGLIISERIRSDLEGINQVNVNPKVGLTFASSLRAFLRQDPDIIMVGEIRDPETGSIAAEAALTGARGNSGAIVAQFLHVPQVDAKPLVESDFQASR